MQCSRGSNNGWDRSQCLSSDFICLIKIMKLKPDSFSTFPTSPFFWEKFSGMICTYEGKYIIHIYIYGVKTCERMSGMAKGQ